jgi:hypothetical protein
MSILGQFPKQPGEILDYDISFADWLLERGDSIQSLQVAASEGITIESSAHNAGIVKVWISGGTHGRKYKVTAAVETLGGRRKEGDIEIAVKELGISGGIV